MSERKVPQQIHKLMVKEVKEKQANLKLNKLIQVTQ
jgi:hypothetical protein